MLDLKFLIPILNRKTNQLANPFDVNLPDYITNTDYIVTLRNIKNKPYLFHFISNLYLPLRHTLLWDINILTTFVKIIKFFDVPYRFDLDKKILWRYNAKAYGTFFDKKMRSHVLYFTMGLKRNIGVSIPYFMNFPSPTQLQHVVDWHKFSFLFSSTLYFDKNTTIDNNLPILLKQNKINFFPINEFHKCLIPISTHIINKRFHRCLNLSDIDIDPWVTTFDYRFWSSDIYDANYQKSTLDKVDFSWGVHKNFISSSFFITSFDTRVLLYPELYFKYLNIAYSQARFFQSIRFFKLKDSKNFYLKVLNLFSTYYTNKLKKNLLNISYNNFYDITYKKNYFINIIYFSLLFNKNLLNNNIYSRFNINRYFFKPGRVIQNVLLKNYFYFRSRKYKKKTKLFLCFRSHFAKKVPIKFKYIRLTNFSYLYINNIFRSFYSNYYKYFKDRLQLFWKFFFTFFIQNIKKRFFIINYNTNDYSNFIYDLIFFLRKFFSFNKYLKKYFNIKFFSKVSKKNSYLKMKFNKKKKNLLNNYINNLSRQHNILFKNITKNSFKKFNIFNKILRHYTFLYKSSLNSKIKSNLFSVKNYSDKVEKIHVSNPNFVYYNRGYKTSNSNTRLTRSRFSSYYK